MTATAVAQQFAAEVPPAMQWTAVLHVPHGDTDHDGDRDLHLQVWSPGRWSAFLHNDGTGNFTDHGNTLVQIGEKTSAFVDFDGDGDDDLFVSLVGRGQLLRRDPGGWTDVTAQMLPQSPAWHEMIVGDLDGDGDLDLAGVGNVLIAGSNRVLRNNWPIGFSVIDPFPGTNSRIRAADIDGDGDLDVLLGPQFTGGPPALWRNDGGMTFTGVGASWLPASLPAVNTFEFGDVDGDGDADLVLGSTAGNDLLLRNTGAAFVAVPGALPPNAGTTFFPRFGDVDGDGDLDLWRGETSSVVATTLALNDGTGNFTAAPARLPPGGAPETIRAVADLDGDGDVDAVTSGAGGATILWNRHRHVSSPAAPQLGTPWTVELWSQPGYGSTVRAGMLAIGIARLPQRLVLPPFGTLWLDLTAEVLLVPVQFLPAAGAATFVFAVPATPALAGQSLHIQGIVEDAPGLPRLTSARTVTIQ